jgi:methionyl-tRNA formyltransferase
MKIIFFGTPNFASEILKSIYKEHKVLSIVTAEDSQKGRGKKYKSPSVKLTAQELKIPVIQPKNLKDPTFINQLKKLNADLYVVIAFRMLPELAWSIPKLGTINIHTSYLPDYRGAAPINWVLINGEKTTGVTSFYINNEIDKGNILLQEKIELSDDITAAQLHEQLILSGTRVIIQTLEKISKNKITSVQQNEEKNHKNAPKIHKDLSKINWEDSIKNIHNKIRGLSSYINDEILLKDVSICPCAWFEIKINTEFKRVKIQKSHITDVINKNVIIDTDNKNFLNINCGQQALSLDYLQIEGKKAMNIKQFLQGNNINSSDIIR